jgi:succinate dehydrogenase / fumarate reductase, cytochrome b subunit
MPDRPLSPHVWLYKFKYTLFSSILNRITGCVITAGLLVLVYWLMALAQGPQAYARAEVVLSHTVFKLLFIALTFTVAYHFTAGIRHLVWDTGRGLERRQSQKSAWLVGIVSVLLTVCIVCGFWQHMGAA